MISLSNYHRLFGVLAVLVVGGVAISACQLQMTASASVQPVTLTTIALASPPTNNAWPTVSPFVMKSLTPTPKPTKIFVATPTLTITPNRSLLPSVTTTQTMTYAPVVANYFRPQASLLGVALQTYTNEHGLENGLELGIRYVRRWQPLAWRDVEPREDEYHWEVLAGLESELLRARASGLQPIIEIQYTPSWAQKVPPYSCGPIRSDKFEAFAAFMVQMVTRFGSASPYGVRYWQLGNELDVAPGEVPGDSIFGCWGDLNDPVYGGGYYAEMLKVVYPRIKAADPNAQVMMGGLLLECDPATTIVGVNCISERRWKSGYFLEGVMKAGGGDYFDIVDVHSYAELSNLPSHMHSFYAWSGPLGGTGLPEKVAFVRNVMGKYGYGNKPVFIGEVALKCQQPTAECYDAAAAFVPRVFAEAYGLNVLGTVYFPILSDQSYYALMSMNFAPRPMFWAYKFLGSQLTGSRYERVVTEYLGISGFMFRLDNAQRRQIIWSTDGTDQTIDLPTNFSGAYDKFGNAIPPETGKLIIGWSPIYIELK